MVAESGEMKHSSNCAEDPLFKSFEDKVEYIPGSLICVPVRFQDTVLGVLNISHSKANAFTEWHERFLRVFSNMLGQLIMFNRTIDDMDSQINQRTMELQSALARAESLSTRDELTGIHNRRYFISHFNKFIQQCERYKCNMAVLMIDIDDFKSINDTYGHIEGDLTLIKVAKTLTQCARNADIVARLGGEEFIFAVQHSNCEDVKEIADRVLEKVRQLVCGEKQSYKITASIGISCSDDISEIAGKDIEKWMHEADQALYQAKHSGKDCVVIYDGEK
jgi:diguanylate cyclase (GGDEF)-like protein